MRGFREGSFFHPAAWAAAVAVNVDFGEITFPPKNKRSGNNSAQHCVCINSLRYYLSKSNLAKGYLLIPLAGSFPQSLDIKEEK